MFFVSLLCVVKAGAQDAAVISGVMEDKSLNRVFLYKVVEGLAVECGRYPIGEDRTCRIEYVPEYEGFYAIGHPEKQTGIYLKKGDQVNLRVLEKKIAGRTRCCLNGMIPLIFLIGTAQNWMENPGCTYVEFFPSLNVWKKDFPLFVKV